MTWRDTDKVPQATPSSLGDVREVVSGVGNFRNLSLAHGRGDVPVFCPNQWRIVRHFYCGIFFRDRQRDVDRHGRAEQNVHHSAFVSKAFPRHTQYVFPRREKEKSVGPLEISFRLLNRSPCIVGDHNIGTRYDRIAGIGYDARQPTGGCRLSVQPAS